MIPVIFSAFLELLLVPFYFHYCSFLSTFYIYSFYHHSIQPFSILFHEFDMLFSSFCFHFIKNVPLFGLVSSWRFVFGVVYTIVSTLGQKRKFNCIQAIVSGSLDCARSHRWLQCEGCPTRVIKISFRHRIISTISISHNQDTQLDNLALSLRSSGIAQRLWAEKTKFFIYLFLHPAPNRTFTKETAILQATNQLLSKFFLLYFFLTVKPNFQRQYAVSCRVMDRKNWWQKTNSARNVFHKE